MSHFGRTGPPDITDTYSLLVLNITFRKPFFLSLSLSFKIFVGMKLIGFVFDLVWVWILGTTADDLFPYFDKYGKVVDIFIPRNRRYYTSITKKDKRKKNLAFKLNNLAYFRAFGFSFISINFCGLGLVTRGVSRLCGTSTLTRRKKPWIG